METSGETDGLTGTSPAQSGAWKLLGYDTFGREWYGLAEFASEVEAVAAAKARLKELEEQQPTDISGGQDGIQDQVHVFRPGGTSYRVRE